MLPLLWLWAFKLFLYVKHAMFVISKFPFHLLSFFMTKTRFFFLRRRQSGVNLQVCVVNDSSSDKDSDAEDSRTETSLDTPLSPVVRTCRVSVCGFWSHDMGTAWLNLSGRCIWTEQAELIAVRPGHCRGGLRSIRWLWGVLASAKTATGGGPGGAGSGPTHGPNAGGGREANPAAQTFACGRPG